VKINQPIQQIGRHFVNKMLPRQQLDQQEVPSQFVLPRPNLHDGVSLSAADVPSNVTATCVCLDLVTLTLTDADHVTLNDAVVLVTLSGDCDRAIGISVCGDLGIVIDYGTLISGYYNIRNTDPS